MGQSPLRKFHPKTGALLKPLLVDEVTGKAVWPIMGASPDDSSNEDGGSGGSNDSEGGNGNEGTGSEGQGSEGESGGEEKTYSKAEYEALQERMKAADRRASSAEQKIKEQEDAKKGDLEKANDKVKEHETTISTLQKEVSDLRLQNAFLSANEHSWHDADEALASAQRNGYLEGVVKEDGSVDKSALKTALKRLATEKKFLLKSSSSDSGSGSSGPSGGNVGSGSGSSMSAKDEEALRRKYPALNL